MYTTKLQTFYSLLIVVFFSCRGLCMPPLPDVDTCTPKSGACVNDTSQCIGFIDTSGLCRNDYLCCKPAPSTLQPEPQYPGFETCGLITRIKSNKRISSRIVGGVDSEEGEWPWMISIHDYYGHFCGGTLVSSTWALTAAHCLYGLTTGDFNLTLGEHHTAFVTGNEKTVLIDSLFIHPNYSGGSLGNSRHDIALIKLSEHVDTFGHYIRTACLPTTTGSNGRESDLELDCYVSGWGSTVGTGDNRQLKHIKVPLVPISSCNDSWFGNIQETNICAGNGETGACKGDSGGPLVCNVRGLYYIYGVTSWGSGSCQMSGFPDVYTRVTSYLPWIQNTQKKHEFVQDKFYSTIRKILNSILKFIKMCVDEILS